jgi:hypothetical protein
VGTECDLGLAVQVGLRKEEGRERSWAVASVCGAPVKYVGVLGQGGAQGFHGEPEGERWCLSSVL